jgi:RimJ/RimL family protein N-acetyltransferase
MSDLSDRRRAIRHLLRERDPADGLAGYYAFHHPDDKTGLIIEPEGTTRADGYVALSRTGIDLFRPLVTMRLPVDRTVQDYQASVDLLTRALAPGAPVILSVPQRYMPLIRVLFDIQAEEALRLYALRAADFKPVINVLVTQSVGANGLPRYTIRSQEEGGEVVAAASLNWQSPHFGEIAVQTRPQNRRQGWGRSVVAALTQHLLDSGRVPLYVVAEDNLPSIQLAEALGFTDTGAREYMVQAAIKGVNQA